MILRKIWAAIGSKTLSRKFTAQLFVLLTTLAYSINAFAFSKPDADSGFGKAAAFATTGDAGWVLGTIVLAVIAFCITRAQVVAAIATAMILILVANYESVLVTAGTLIK